MKPMQKQSIDSHSKAEVKINPEAKGLEQKKSKAASSETGPERLSCPVETTLEVIGGRWKVLILRELIPGVRRFNDLHRSLHGITQKMLTQQLREMEEDGLIHREVYLQVPPKVEYSLTQTGQTLEPILEAMHHWGVQYRQSRSEQVLSGNAKSDSSQSDPAN
jgi:DNA-binding HxlR family transcriptional regulator